MKNFLLCSLYLLVLNSCSIDSDKSSNFSTIGADPINHSIIPQNPINHLDSVGKEYIENLNAYSQQKGFPNSIKEMEDQVSFISKKFGNASKTGKSEINFNNEIVESLMTDPDNSMIVIVENSSLSTSVKINLINFLQTLITQREEDFSVIYDFIVNYESIIINDTTISTDEKDTLLTVTSISRYSLYSESERKDRDWETSVASKQIKSLFSKNEMAIISIIAIIHIII